MRVQDYLTQREQFAATVLLVTIAIPFTVGMLSTTYQSAAGLYLLLSVVYLGYRFVLYHPIQYVLDGSSIVGKG